MAMIIKTISTPKIPYILIPTPWIASPICASSSSSSPVCLLMIVFSCDLSTTPHLSPPEGMLNQLQMKLAWISSDLEFLSLWNSNLEVKIELSNEVSAPLEDKQ